MKGYFRIIRLVFP